MTKLSIDQMAEYEPGWRDFLTWTLPLMIIIGPLLLIAYVAESVIKAVRWCLRR